MTKTLRRWTAMSLLALSCHAPSAFAQPLPQVQARLHAEAVASFRQARFAEAYGRFLKLANAGHAPSAELALWMYLHGPTMFGQECDSHQDQLTEWARLAGQKAPVMAQALMLSAWAVPIRGP